ncbi:TatD family hydrolase [Ferruginibacter lapsinanis]|uniref:TatD family hydrolase n=1 Tax=Ferruginibacter lapsinanis TaxID=563172 RepID=UPI001E51EBBF|nr:TatD family hydrolase [Ferruginibacter lapsinanis]UEG49107.1 TatD family hydrolase [Ferruginibacter lapsinanis]
MLINIHSHHSSVSDEWTIKNLHNNFAFVATEGYFSIGLHPWYLQKDTFDKEITSLIKWSSQKSVLAIGECGLDKICSTDFLFQKKVFTAQILLANKINKPIIIHCVRAYDEVLELLQQNNNHVPVIFHGFNKNKELAEKLIDKGYYLSFGKALMQTRVQELLVSLPLQQVFFETDDFDSGIDVVYSIAATALKIDTFSLSLQIQKNVAKVFGDDLF